jgi:hypothetical protein
MYIGEDIDWLLRKVHVNEGRQGRHSLRNVGGIKTPAKRTGHQTGTEASRWMMARIEIIPHSAPLGEGLICTASAGWSMVEPDQE